jgi:hypothetical protein
MKGSGAQAGNGVKRKASESEVDLGVGAQQEGSDSDEGFEDGDGDEPDTERTPISHELILKDHTKVRSYDTQSRVILISAIARFPYATPSPCVSISDYLPLPSCVLSR